ncbi:TBC1 domain family member 10A-like [Lytechinus pictus]|uniref:TBC1 domain family member 10A-like n=1 Tax=Lytechinus pictus TaxID=7653 RepID=UPI0030B9DF44
MSVENEEGSSIGQGPCSDEENGIDPQQGGASSLGNDSATGGASSVGNESLTGGASSIGNGSATGGMDLVDSDLSDDEEEGPQTDRYGFLGGKQFTGGELGLPIEILRKRELKWLDMIDDWEKWMTKKPKKVRERCRKGIPSSLRGRAWQFLCGSKRVVEQNKDKFLEFDAQEGDPKWLDVIEKDLDRQFPFHEMFAKKGGNGQQDLYRILKAYSIYNPRDGYCQGQAPVAAVLLMHMPAETAQANWDIIKKLVF